MRRARIRYANDGAEHDIDVDDAGELDMAVCHALVTGAATIVDIDPPLVDDADGGG